MRFFALELKRLLKRRSTCLLILFMLAFSVLMAWLPTTYEISYTADGAILTGSTALSHNKDLQADYAGTVTTEKVHQALLTYQGVYERYDTVNNVDLPAEVRGTLLAIDPLLNGIGDLYADEHGQPIAWLEVDPARVSSYYDTIPSRIALTHPGDAAATDYFLALYEHVDTPFTFVPGANATALEYMLLLALILLLGCAYITAPIFAGDYQSGADAIQRCTRHGRARLAGLRILAALLLSGLLSGGCIALYWIVSNSLFGWEGLDTSVQLLYLFRPITPLPFTLGELQVVLSLLGLLTILSTISAILLISSLSKNLVIASFAAIGLCILPIFVYMIAPDRIALWLLTLLPSSGVGLSAGTLYAMRSFDLLRIGDLLCWTPIAMSFASAIELPVFLLLTLRSYTHRSA